MTTPYVLDTSVAVAWCFEDEATPGSRALLDSLVSRTAVVPSLWKWEVANALLSAERRKRLDPAATGQFLRLLARLPIRVDEDAAGHASGDTMELARTHDLTAHDAAYLELARRLDLPLATRDTALLEAARAASVTTLPA